jgi:hypothetical protein
VPTGKPLSHFTLIETGGPLCPRKSGGRAKLLKSVRMEGSFGKNLACCTFGTVELQPDAATLPTFRPRCLSESDAPHQDASLRALPTPGRSRPARATLFGEGLAGARTWGGAKSATRATIEPSFVVQNAVWRGNEASRRFTPSSALSCRWWGCRVRINACRRDGSEP